MAKDFLVFNYWEFKYPKKSFFKEMPANLSSEVKNGNQIKVIDRLK